MKQLLFAFLTCASVTYCCIPDIMEIIKNNIPNESSSNLLDKQIIKSVQKCPFGTVEDGSVCIGKYKQKSS